MSEFVLFSLANKLEGAGLRVKGHSMYKVAEMCTTVGIQELDDLAGIKTEGNFPQLREDDQKALQDHIFTLACMRSHKIGANHIVCVCAGASR